MNDKQRNLGLTAYDDLFSSYETRQEQHLEKVQDIPLSEISIFPHQPFKVRMDESMQEMVDSISQHGVLVPALVRPKSEGGYEMIAGHRRLKASELAGQETISCIVRDLTDDEAIIILVDSNLQREQILPSEKAFAYKMKLDAMKRQGYRSDLTSYPMDKKLKGITSAQEISISSGDSQPQIYRYIRLTNLLPEILEMVDNSVLKEKGILQIAFRPAVELSYLTPKQQQMLYESMECEECTPSLAQAIQLRQYAQKGDLTQEFVDSVLQEEKPNQKEQFKIPKESISRYFAPGTPTQKIQETIIRALEFYRKRQRENER